MKIHDSGAIVGTATYSGSNTNIATGSHGVLLAPAYEIQVDAFNCQTYVGWDRTVSGPKALLGGVEFFTTLAGNETVDEAALAASNVTMPSGTTSDPAQLVSVFPSSGGLGGSLTAKDLQKAQ
jgi:hypothetical protein